MFKRKSLNYFEILYEKTYNKTLNYIVLNCKNMDDVNDILQDTYVELYKIINKKKISSLDNPSAYVIGIAKNKLKKYYSFKYKFNDISLFSGEESQIIDFVKSDVNIENIVITNENIKDIWEFIKKKKALIGKIFYFHYYMDMTIKEISKELNVKESTIKSNLYRTLKEMNEVFGKDKR